MGIYVHYNGSLSHRDIPTERYVPVSLWICLKLRRDRQKDPDGGLVDLLEYQALSIETVVRCLPITGEYELVVSARVSQSGTDCASE